MIDLSSLCIWLELELSNPIETQGSKNVISQYIEEMKKSEQASINSNTEFILINENESKSNNNLINFTPSRFIDDKSDLWKIETILGEEEFFINLSKSGNEVNEYNIIEWFKRSDMYYWINSEGDRLLTVNNSLIEKRYGKLKTISAYDSLEKFGIDILEEAIEKSYVVL